MRQVNPATIALVKYFESLHDGDLRALGLQPKRCPAGIWTVGYGHALSDRNNHFLRRESDRDEAYRQYGNMSVAQAETLLALDINVYAEQVERLLNNVSVSDNQFGAMVSLSYNIGLNAFKGSSVLRLTLAGYRTAAANAFLLWIKATKANGVRVVMQGLVNRREAERKLFLKV